MACFKVCARFFRVSGFHDLLYIRNDRRCVNNTLNQIRHASTATPVKPRRSTLYLGLVSLSAGAIVGGIYSFYTIQQSKLPILNEGVGTKGVVLKSLPSVPVSRKVVVPTDSSGLKLTLFQYPTCPFCCKVRAFLDYYGISYDVIEVNPVLRQQIKWSDYKKVPILLAKVEGGYQQLNDSTMIISALKSYLLDKRVGLQNIVDFYPNIAYHDDQGERKVEIFNRYFLMLQEELPNEETRKQFMQEVKWRRWADETLVHMLSPNVYRTTDEALQAFNWFSEVGEWDKLFSQWERLLVIYVGAYAMYFIGKKLKKRHNLKDEVRQSLYDECNHWLKAIKSQGSNFMGGDSPNLADLAVYGVLSSIEGCDAFKDLLNETKIGTWYFAVKENVQEHKGSPT